MPYCGSEPKSGCRPRLRPIAAINCAEFGATGSAETSRFHTFDAGKIGHRGAPGSGAAVTPRPSAVAVEPIAVRTAARARTRRIRIGPAYAMPVRTQCDDLGYRRTPAWWSYP